MMFLLGVVVGIFFATIVIVGGFISITRKRRTLLSKATNLWTRATELVETANIWAAIGSEEDAQEAMAAAKKLAEEAKKCEEEANGGKSESA